MMQKYEACMKESNTLLRNLEGALLKGILINVVDPEFNVVYLETDKGNYALHGEVGGEYLGIHCLAKLPEISELDGYIICKYSPFNIFEGRTISQARQVGTAWQGHGYEFSFDGLLTKTMIIQSIYCGTKPQHLEDCLRLGVGHYENEWKRT